MWEEIFEAFYSVYLPSMLKFILGPVGGALAQLNFFVTVIATTAGMMTVVVLLTFFRSGFQKLLDRFFPNRKRFSQRNERFSVIWKKYGLAGVAALTPLLLTPIGGTLLAVSLGGNRATLWLYMLISATFWSFVFTGLIYYFGNEVFPEFMR
ncbi:MAG: hypothetical protein MUC38_11195 [Cyclobacteriaceae bacterium]|nr:hypothetical protein [Cyclobacteriaceae bacterium]